MKISALALIFVGIIYFIFNKINYLDIGRFEAYNDELIASRFYAWLPHFIPKDAKNITVKTHVETNYMEAIFFTLNQDVMHMNESDTTLTAKGREYINDEWGSTYGFCKLGSDGYSSISFFIIIKIQNKKNYYAIVNQTDLIESACFPKPILPHA